MTLTKDVEDTKKIFLLLLNPYGRGLTANELQLSEFLGSCHSALLGYFL